jgi:hypothetical protein
MWQEPQDGHQYIMGADVAEGRGENADNSAFQIFDMNTMDQVAEFYSNTIAPHDFAMVVARVGIYYNTALIVVESNFGSAVLDKLEHNLYYENLYYQRSRTTERAGVTMNKASRPVILAAMQTYLENNLCRVNSSRLLRELETFRLDKSKKKFEAERGHHDDLIMSLSIALYVRDRYLREIPAGAELPEGLTDSTTSYKYEQIRREIEDASIMPYERKNSALLKEFDF